jgi:hypothetical protein
LAAPFRPVIIAGDFNLTRANPLFQTNWSRYNDAFSDKGIGLGYTKHTRWHGARIDHLLSDDNWQTVSSVVGPDIGGDHHPLITRLVFTGRQGVVPEIPSARGQVNFPGVAMNQWDLGSFPMVSFSYAIPPRTPLVLRVKTEWGDWVCLGSVAGECPSAKTTPDIQLINDGAWHTVEFDVRAAVKSILPMVRSLTEFQFMTPNGNNTGVEFRIDGFRIFGQKKTGLAD